MLGQTLRLFLILAFLTGLVYPLAVTGLAEFFFPGPARGSLVERQGRVAGSALLAQAFARPGYFWPRPSGNNYSTRPSGGANLGPTSRALQERVAANRQRYARGQDSAVPADLIFNPASGLDPHISPAAARFQLARVAQARGWEEARIAAARRLIEQLTEAPDWGFLGSPRVNVLRLNLAVDRLDEVQP